MIENLNQIKKEVPQIHFKTGVSQDYVNQINGVVTAFKNRGIDFVKILLKQVPFHMEKYEEVYLGYQNIVNDKNRDSIKKLDELAIQMNEILKDPNFIDEDILRKTCNEIYSLIYGDESIKI